MKIRENVPISDLTTMRLGGAARFVIEIFSSDDVAEAYKFAQENQLPVYVLGSGANTIGRDEGFNGVILQNKMKDLSIYAACTKDGVILTDERPAEIQDATSENTQVPEESPCDPSALEDECAKLAENDVVWAAGGGLIWDDFVETVCNAGCSGIEALAAVPGTVGAAPVQNIGAYGQDISQTLFAVDVYDTKTLSFATLFADELGFSYRRSLFNSTEKGRYFILRAYFRLRRKTTVLDSGRPLYDSLQLYLEDHDITDYSPSSIAAAVRAIRASKLPDPASVASAGSFFKNALLTDAEADAAEKKGVPVRRGDQPTKPAADLVAKSAAATDSTKPTTTTAGPAEPDATATPRPHKVNSGWLVEHSGLLGKDLHGFKINDKAALVLINDHAKSYADLAQARQEIIDAVYEKFGIKLEQEPEELEVQND